MKKSKDVVVVQEVDKYTVTRLLIPENKEGGRLLNTHSQGRPTTTTTATTTLATSAMTLNVATHSLLHATHSTPTLSPGFSLCNTLQRYTRSGFSLCKTLHTNALATSASTLKAADEDEFQGRRGSRQDWAGSLYDAPLHPPLLLTRCHGAAKVIVPPTLPTFGHATVYVYPTG
ncbi:hypothetical protein Pcinc_012619 [Petrolisthes cinctipes]|uniref:Uncharacterized protein n=1 Tax=Petrolisthes cinctipes TaxID=88211 RepID=A0AAE1KV69_PETCI|nr:hypothetical protein Pcinc_012619 [Petrolisthes cinctipes]